MEAGSCVCGLSGEILNFEWRLVLSWDERWNAAIENTSKRTMHKKIPFKCHSFLQCERTLDMIFFLWRMSLLLLSSFEFQQWLCCTWRSSGIVIGCYLCMAKGFPGKGFPWQKNLATQPKAEAARKKQLLTGITCATLCALPKTNMEPEHHSLQKEVHLPNLPFWRFRISFRFFGGCNTRSWFKILFIFTPTWGIYI